jgi:hypothetical protein
MMGCFFALQEIVLRPTKKAKPEIEMTLGGPVSIRKPCNSHIPDKFEMLSTE